VLGEINAESIRDLWCGFAGPMSIVTGPDIATHPDGVIVVRPNFDIGSSGSVMANLGDEPNVLAPQDKLAACIVYHPDTHIGNFYPDVNPTYR